MNFEQYVLVGSTARSYLSWLKDTGKWAVKNSISPYYLLLTLVFLIGLSPLTQLT